jgi:pimeloyl-ACP methyl ester carboxylesterase
VRVINRGGPANPEVLVLARGGAPPLLVKDYARRSRLSRLLGPALVRHELAMLERLAGVGGVPRARGRLGRFALAMELIDGAPLRRHALQDGLSPAFFDALDGIAAAIAARGVVHLDLRSPTNVLCTASGAPAVVDLASAVRLPLPRSLARRLHARAVRKLRRRFERPDVRDAPATSALRARDLPVGRVRFRLLDVGAIDDPVPALLLHDVGLSGATFTEVAARADAAGRRAIAPDLPPFGASSRVRSGFSPGAQAERAVRLLDALRVARVDVVGHGWGGLVGRALAEARPERVRAVLTLDTPLRALEGRWLARVEAARAGAASLVDLLEAELPDELDAATRDLLRLYLRHVSTRPIARALRALRADPKTGALRAPALPSQPWLALVAGPVLEPASEALARSAPGAPAQVVVCEWPAAWLGAADCPRLWEELARLSA